MKILLDIRVTVTFQRTFQPSAGLSYWKIGTRQMCMKWLLLIIRHVNSVEQCRTVSTVSTVIARCYLHLRWYFYVTYVLYRVLARCLRWRPEHICDQCLFCYLLLLDIHLIMAKWLLCFCALVTEVPPSNIASYPAPCPCFLYGGHWRSTQINPMAV